MIAIIIIFNATSASCAVSCAIGYGLRVIGGVKCGGGELHAQVVCVNPENVPEQLASLTTGENVVIFNSTCYNSSRVNDARLRIVYRCVCIVSQREIADRRNF